MKIVVPGTLVYANGNVIVTGWAFDPEGEIFADHHAFATTLARAALTYVAQTRGLVVGPPPPAPAPDPVERSNVAAERLTLDALAAMRWGPDPTTRSAR